MMPIYMRISKLTVLVTALISGSMLGCGPKNASGAMPLVIFSQANSSDPWRQSYDQEMAAAAKAHEKDFTFQEVNAQGDATKQASQIKDAIAQHPQYLVVNPVSEAVLPAVSDAHKAGIFVILVDKPYKNSEADAYVGVPFGTIATALLTMAPPNIPPDKKGGTVVVLSAPTQSDIAKDVSACLPAAQKRYRRTKFVFAPDCGYSEAKAKDFISSYLKSKQPADAITAVNADMALGAVDAIGEAKSSEAPAVYAFGTNKQIFNDVKTGVIKEDFILPAGGPKALDVIADAIKGNKPQKDTPMFMDMIRQETADNYLRTHPQVFG